jgi:hypothetical protein
VYKIWQGVGVFSEVNEGRGLVKCYWQDVREKVAKVQPVFAQIVDELGVDKKFPLYLAYYPYGALKGDTLSTFIPKVDGGYYRLTDPNAPKDIIKNLGYGMSSAPLAMLLEKNMELFIDLKDEGVTIPAVIYKPGDMFPFARILSRNSERVYAPNGVLTLTSGIRSTFMLPNIGCSTHHLNLQRDFNIKNHAPKTLYEHWDVFKELVNSQVIGSTWRSCLMYFSRQWLAKLDADPAWHKMKLFLHELAWTHYEYERNHLYYDVAFSVMQKKRNLKPNPYLVDTARHLFAVALGAAPGYAPATDDRALPLDVIKRVYVDSYGLKKYYVSLMHPLHYSFESDKYPVYYSLQHPSTRVFSPKSRKISSTLAELRELDHITRIFTSELSNPENMCSDTIIGSVSHDIEFNYFHNKVDRHGIVKHSSKIADMDDRFSLNDLESNLAVFSSDAPFVRGCVCIYSSR